MLLIAPLILPVSCGDTGDDQSAPVYGAPDERVTMPRKAGDVALFADAIPSGEPVRVEGLEDAVDLEVWEVGTLRTSGRIVVCDGLVWSNNVLHRRTQPGEYPVTVLVAKLGRGDARVAFARVQFADGQAERWVPATPEGSETTSDGLWAYPVDAGTGSFWDAAALADAEADFSKVSDGLLYALDQSRQTTWSHAQANMSSGTGVLFTSGWGDGGYASYWGLDSNEVPVALMTDFKVVAWHGSGGPIRPNAGRSHPRIE